MIITIFYTWHLNWQNNFEWQKINRLKENTHFAMDVCYCNSA